MAKEYYQLNKILTIKDLDGVLPWLIMVVGNRTAGKTFAIKAYLIRQWMRRRKKFVVFVRWHTDLRGVVTGFFDRDVGPLKFPDHDMSQRPVLGGMAQELLFDGVPCGYIIALNDVDKIKANSALFSDADYGFLDEFQPESGRYCQDEVHKLWTIVVSISRGGKTGAHIRNFRVFLASNNITLYNPYYDYFGVSTRLKPETKFLRGHGWCLEQTLNYEAAEAMRARYKGITGKDMDYAASNIYLRDTDAFLDPSNGPKGCLAVFVLRGKSYSVWGMARDDIWLISSRLKGETRNVYACTDDDHKPGTVRLARTAEVFKFLRKSYQQGMVRFDTGSARAAWLEILEETK